MSLPHVNHGKMASLIDAHEVIQYTEYSHMRLIRVPTDEQLADIFTKALPFPQFEQCLMGLMGGNLEPKGP